MASTEQGAASQKRETLIDRIIEASARNKFLVFIFTIFAVAAGICGLMHTPLDAIPDLSDVQVIVYTDWEGRSPDLVEDQITYPISTRLHRRAQSEIRSRRIDVRQIVRLRHLSGRHGHLLGAFARD